MDTFSDGWEDLTIACRIQTASSLNELEEIVLEAAQPFGAENVVGGMASRSNQNGTRSQRRIMLSRSSQDWGERYFSKNHFDSDPVIRCVRAGRSGFEWREIDARFLDGAGARILQEAAGHGISTGYTVAFPLRGDCDIALSITGRHLEMPVELRPRFNLLAAWTLGKAASLSFAAPASAHLSRREEEAFALVRSGLTKRQIAGRMGISDHGADKHLRSIRRKFGVSRLTEAVAKWGKSP